MRSRRNAWQPSPLTPTPGGEAEPGFHQRSPRMRSQTPTASGLRGDHYHTVTSVPRAPYQSNRNLPAYIETDEAGPERDTCAAAAPTQVTEEFIPSRGAQGQMCTAPPATCQPSLWNSGGSCHTLGLSREESSSFQRGRALQYHEVQPWGQKDKGCATKGQVDGTLC